MQRVVRAAAVVEGKTDCMSMSVQDLMKELVGRALSTMSAPIPSIRKKTVVLWPVSMAFRRSREFFVALTGVGSPESSSRAWIRSVKLVRP